MIVLMTEISLFREIISQEVDITTVVFFYLTQSMYSLDGSVIRKNANIFILFEINARNLSDLLRDYV